ncbi:hypothetical protein SAMN05661096_03209 [Marivirga sericea]|uniref:Uncharacterized protein n=1 Tax=Marivirga sericea TaxID=1028 RepID=A0A1X7KXR6_9BACT|nr:hypothetical protein [Marivirga sericea]SMG46013.1 hypothetical protein SAMN05661096_03209 [Marivirga sericea]
MEKSKIYYETATASVFWDQGLNALFLQYNSKVKDLDEFIEINSNLLQAFQQLDTTIVVADIRKMSIISLEAQAWIVENLFPGLLKHLQGKKLFHAQLIDPKEILSKVAASNLRKKSVVVEKGFTIEQFVDEHTMEEVIRLKNSALVP